MHESLPPTAKGVYVFALIPLFHFQSPLAGEYEREALTLARSVDKAS
jgi:hypothetical protein